jgi:hypothetical protein
MSKKTTNGFKSDVLALGSVKLGALGVGIMEPRTNSTGSVGLNHSGKVSLDVAGERKMFQVSLNVTLAHSKPEDPKRIPQADIDAFLALPPQDLKSLRLDNALADAREFSSGKVGFYFNGKANVGGKPCQVGCSITAIGSDTWDDQRPAEREAK